MTILGLFANMSLGSILKIYGLLCLICLPVSLVALILIYKNRPDIIDGFNRAIDRLTDDKETGKENTTENPGEPVNEKQKNENEMTEQEENESTGIPNLVLKVGDRYRCHLSQKNRNDIRGGDMTWGCDNPFICSINEYRGIFEARKSGKTYVECGAQHVRIYYVDIRPNNTEWFGYNPINDIISKTDINNVKVRDINLKINNLNTDNKTIEYSIPEGTVTYEWGKRNEVTRVLMKISDETEIRKTIESEISEYMEVIKKKEQDENIYWIHRCGLDTDFPDSVDFIAFLKPASDGKLYFGIGESWREGASVTEIMENIDMMFRTFRKLMDKKHIPDKVGMKKEASSSDRNKKKKAVKKKTTLEEDGTKKITVEDPTEGANVYEPSEDDFPDIEEDLIDGYEEETDTTEEDYTEEQ